VDYSPAAGFSFLNLVSTVGSFILGISTLFFLINVVLTARRPAVAGDNPWVYGQSLEWVTTSPPPRQNFGALPRIRSNRPAWDVAFPDHPSLGHTPRRVRRAR
jgi:cytochrome c oxidase subunit 1